MEGERNRFIKRMFITGERFFPELKSVGNQRLVNRTWDMSNNYHGKGPSFIFYCIAFSQAAFNPHDFPVTIICWTN